LSSSLSDKAFDPEDWISQAEAARIRGVTRQAIHDLVRRERVRTLEIGDKVLVFREDIENFERNKGGRPPKE
jgi:predicted DNA-binding protein YlxM (UPF0122 family)